jgi:hypothetical protein
VLAHAGVPEPARGQNARGQPGQTEPLGKHRLHDAGRYRCARSPAPRLPHTALYISRTCTRHCTRAARIAEPGLDPEPASARVTLINCCECAAD